MYQLRRMLSTLQMTYNDQEVSQEPSEHAPWDKMENVQERPTEEDETECPLGKVRDSLLDYGDRNFLKRTSRIMFGLFFF